MIIIFEKMIVKLIEILFALEQHGNLGITDFTQSTYISDTLSNPKSIDKQINMSENVRVTFQSNF